MFYVVFVIVTGIVNLAPLSNPTTVNVVFNWELDPNNVLTVVALKLICDPITVEETFVPKVVVEVAFWAVAAVDWIPTPLNVAIVLTSAIVAVYPEVSNAVVLPK